MFKGSIVALITPFRNGDVDEKALRNLVDWQIDQGTNGIVPCGTTGESPTLNHEEHNHVVDIVIEQVNGRVPVIAGAGSNSTAEAISLTQHAKDAGADAVLHVTGYYNKPSQEGQYQHFKAIHDTVEIPIIIYNIPPRAIVEVSVETMVRLAELPRVIGVKDATADLTRPSKERMTIKGDWCQLSGEDGTALAYAAHGGDGCISVTANVAPKLCSEFQQACLASDFKTALEYQDRLMPLHVALFLSPSPGPTKYAVSRLDLCQNELRLPLVPIDSDVEERIDDAMRHAGLLN